MKRLVGREASDFTMAAYDGNTDDFRDISLSDYKDKWLVMFFYPLDFTPV